MAPLDVLNEVMDEKGTTPVSYESYKARFSKLWPDYRPHLIFERAEAFHKRLIEDIDPDYVRKQKASAALRSTIQSGL